jgi:CBS domain-containing protein
MFIVDDKQQLVGIITRGDVVQALAQSNRNGTTVATAGSRNVIITYADDLLFEAANKMLLNNIGRLPVVSRKDPRRVVGYIGRRNLMAGRLRHYEDEHVRERRFLQRRVREANLAEPV